MNLTQFASIALIVGLVLLPQVVALLYNGSNETEAEPDYDYR